MNKKYSKDYDTKTVMQDDLSIKAEIIEVQKEIEPKEIIEKKGIIQLRYKITNRSLQVINILLDNGTKNHQLLSKENVVVQKNQISTQINNLKNRGILDILEIKE